MTDISLVYDAHMASSVVFATDLFGLYSPVYPFGSDRAMPTCDAQDLICATVDHGILPEPCNIPIRFIKDEGGTLWTVPYLS